MRLTNNSISVIAAVCLLMILSLAGCSQDTSHGQVYGVVLLDDTPLADAQVEFVPTGAGSTSYGRTDSNGSFSMEYARNTTGASVGENLVRITTGEMYLDGEKTVRVKEKVPVQYNRKSEVLFVVEPGSNKPEFRLSSEGKIWQSTGDASEGE